MQKLRNKDEKRKEEEKRGKEEEKGEENLGSKDCFYKSTRRFFHMRSGQFLDLKSKLYFK